MNRSFLVVTSLVSFLAGPGSAFAAGSGWSPSPDNNLCRENRDSWRPYHCEVRELTLTPRGAIALDAGKNGGVEVTGDDRSDVQVYAIVGARADTEDEARQIVSQIELPSAPPFAAKGPEVDGRRHWWVSYKVRVPRQSDLSLRTLNGPISVSEVSGAIDVNAMNGPVNLSAVGGRVTGRTINGPLNIRLAGSTWSGEGLDVATTNGPVNLSLPANYNARLESGTVNGPVSSDFPVTLGGEGRKRNRSITLTLGTGRPTLRAVTKNGPVRIDKNE